MGRLHFSVFAVSILLAGCPGPRLEERAEATGGTGGACSGDCGGAAGSGTWGGLTPNTTPAEQTIDLFGVPGHRFWAEVNDDQLDALNDTAGGGVILFDENPFGDLYTPGGDSTAEALYLDHLLVEDAVEGTIADYGKVQVRLVGQSTMRPWTASSIPNLKIDLDEFQPDLRMGGEEHLRLNNAQVGSIFREPLADRLYRALGYSAPRSTFAFLGSNVWGPDVWVPMVFTEIYKGKFCRDNLESLGGDCLSMWEFVTDPGVELLPDSTCKLSACETNRVESLPQRVAEAPQGTGFAEALADLIDWPRFHQFQCLSWILWTGDDALHNGNNTIVVERDDGRLVWLPYSVDISLGQDWYLGVPLYGTSAVAMGCQQDEQCWADTITTCEGLIDDFAALEPETLLDESRATLTDLGMMREGDEERAAAIGAWLVERQAALPTELEQFRGLTGPDGCPVDLERCFDGTCGTHEECVAVACSYPQVWCESRQACIDAPYVECPECTVESPLWCEVTAACVLDLATCTAACGDALRYCPAMGACVTEFDWCPSDDGGGGIPIPLLDAQLDRAGAAAAAKPYAP